MVTVMEATATAARPSPADAIEQRNALRITQLWKQLLESVTHIASAREKDHELLGQKFKELEETNAKLRHELEQALQRLARVEQSCGALSMLIAEAGRKP